MDIMQMAAKVSLSRLHNEVTVEGPFYVYRDHREQIQRALIWCRNGYGVTIEKGNAPWMVHTNPVDSETAQLIVMRRTNDVHRFVNDFNNPVTSREREVLRCVTVDEIVDALEKLKDGVNDPDDTTMHFEMGEGF
ncbi:hypothetical protein [Rhodococcus qingshengii]|uniref:hypothetical protein n=1 Tax=Rhodococcus qingshengii TaxID=334542 RepID=UPI0035D6C872